MGCITECLYADVLMSQTEEEKHMRHDRRRTITGKTSLKKEE